MLARVKAKSRIEAKGYSAGLFSTVSSASDTQRQLEETGGRVPR
jgi:hypothetical protein